MHQKLRRFCAFLVGASATGLFSQSNLSQQITADLVDPSGAALQNASITIVQVGTGLTSKTTSNAAGNYTFPDLPTGKYRVTCKEPGFKQQVIDNNSLNTKVSVEVNCRRQIGSQSDSVTIQADAAVVETTNADLGFTVTGGQASELQLNGATSWDDVRGGTSRAAPTGGDGSCPKPAR